ncbi:MAG: diguanylate cyclase domain-containing protein, partial [Terriglobales bacterium]
MIIALVGGACILAAQVFGAFAVPSWALMGMATLLFIGVSALVFGVRRMADARAASEADYRMARRDELTGLPNRRAFLEQLRKANLKRSELCTLIVIDLDHFKPINDIYGHRLGDEVLCTMAERLAKIVDGRGYVARTGGDEFGILLPVVSNTQSPDRIAQAIIEELPRPIKLAALSVNVGVSVGIASCVTSDIPLTALTKQDGSLSETLMRRADMALYKAKGIDENNCQFFVPAMDEQLRLKIELEREIGSAIETGHILPYYQPLVDLKSGVVIGCEVLARWQHPTRGLLSPADFIAIVKGTGNMAALTYSLLHQAITDTRSWPREMCLAVNLSPRMVTDKCLR